MTSFATFGNELYTGKRSYHFVSRHNLWFLIAGIAVILSIALPMVKGGFNLGIEFRGGSEFTISNVANTDVAPGEQAVAAAVAESSEARVTNIAPHTMRIQTERLTDDQTVTLGQSLAEAYGVTKAQVTSTFVGPTWGESLTRQAVIGLIVFVLLAAVLMALYFRTWKMSLAAIVGLLVVLFITEGLYSLSDLEVTPSAVIGFLTILGYSLYDTVVVFDKVRENTANIDKSTRRTFAEEVNLAVNQTLVRSINTSVVAVLPVASILFIGSYLLGAGVLRDLSLSLFIGIIIGTLSTLYIAAPMYAVLRAKEPKLIKQAKRVRAHRAKTAAGEPSNQEQTASA